MTCACVINFETKQMLFIYQVEFIIIIMSTSYNNMCVWVNYVQLFATS